jgi:RND family efflux transporter MFP subunit
MNTQEAVRPGRTPDVSMPDEDGAIPPDLPRVRTWGVLLAAAVVILAFVGLFLLGWIPRRQRLARLSNESARMIQSRPRVQVMKPMLSDAPLSVMLPAQTAAWQQTAIFPQASGYLQKQLADIGQSVKAGQLLAVISMPDVDAQLAQARANVAQAHAHLSRAGDDAALARATLARYEGFFKTGGITQQQLDQYRSGLTTATSDLAGAKAAVQAAEANVRRLSSLQAYEQVVAPFDGTITARNYNLGALMSANNTTPGKELFDIADTSVLRVFVDVDQMYVTSAKVGDPASVEVRNYPGRDFPGAIARTAGALDPATRKMRYEIDVPNPSGLLYPGMYARAVLKIRRGHPAILIPTGALIFDAEGTKVWVAENGAAHVKHVTVGQDLGTNIEIASGLSGHESIITNPGERLLEGEPVDVVAAPPRPSTRP